MPETKPRDSLYIAIFLAAVLALWVGLTFLPGPATVQLGDDVRGSYDLSGAGFENTVYRTASAPVWGAWPEKLYSLPKGWMLRCTALTILPYNTPPTA